MSLGGILVGIYVGWGSVERIILSEKEYLLALPFSPIMVLSAIYVYRELVGDRLDCIAVTNEYVEWLCLLKHRQKLYFTDCLMISVETFDKEGHQAIIRGDENAMIYFTTEPYPEEFRGRINHVHCSDTFIKFRYTDELARTLLEVLPEEKKPAIQAFYNQMQNRDYERQKAIRAWKNNRARRKREKERRKQKKG